MSVVIREFTPSDAQAVADLFNAHPDNPNPVAGGITADQLCRELHCRETQDFLLGVEDNRIVGTFGLFRTNGRLAVEDHELLADMLFIAPDYRGGLLAGQLFGVALERAMTSQVKVIRLTVDPANKAALTLYRRIGCVPYAGLTPCEDGNVELRNYTPLVLRSVAPLLPDEVRRVLRDTDCLRCVVEDEDFHEQHHTSVVPYTVRIGAHTVVADVCLATSTVLRAELRHAEGGAQELLAPTAMGHVSVVEPTHVATHGNATVTLHPHDATLAVQVNGHLGPLATVTWPSHQGQTLSGWRGGQRRALTLSPTSQGFRATEDTHAGTLTCEGILSEHGLELGYTWTDAAAVTMHVVTGLRQALLSTSDGAVDTEPLGANEQVRDASEVPAAGLHVTASSTLTWAAPSHDACVVLRADAPEIVLVNSAIVALRAPGEQGRLRLELAWPGSWQDSGSPRDVDDARPGRALPTSSTRLPNWKLRGRPVLKSPHPRVRRHRHNPTWAAGMWLTREGPRSGPPGRTGWGVDSPRTKQAALNCSFDGDDQLTACVTDEGGEGDVVLWFTPHTDKSGTITFDRCASSTFTPHHSWRRWSSSVDIELSNGRTLSCHNAGGDGQAAEMVTCSTPDGVLVGCVVSFPARGATPQSHQWRFRVHP